ncbi:hypothetical protein EHP00_569 [Ecytonucleospora hepatopenaei]|uniref:Uncharacterized protein n=1 Tax=Ecytonucleospora hepatopenaei TaxID=646526 RepID=A0A1W0E8D2_9MICR|nr:hypothetical protein EHP00_569 [Ecytonucleospora hepatopenaei]
MEIFSREFAYKENLVFLVCDFYFDKYIPESIYEVTDNIALFPVNNYPLIDYILQNLLEQNFTNIVLVGNEIATVIKHVMKGKFDLVMNISYLSNDVLFKRDTNYRYNLENFGQFFRQLLAFNIQNNFLVMPANTFTTFNLEYMRLMLLKNNATSVFYIFDTETNDPEFFKYDFSETGRIFGIVQNKKKKTGDIIKYNSPAFIYTTPVLCNLFNEFQDACDIIQLFEDLKSTFSFGKFAFFCITEELLINQNILNLDRSKCLWGTLQEKSLSDFQSNSCFENSIIVNETSTIQAYSQNNGNYDTEYTYESNMIFIQEKNIYYNKEITTLYDYINICKDLLKYTDVLLSNTRLKKFTEQFKINHMQEMEEIRGKLKKIAATENFVVYNEASNVFLEIKSTGEVFDCYTLDLKLFNEEDSKEIDVNQDSFFEECIFYLKKCFKRNETNLEKVYKNITLFKISSNTTTEEVLEALASFFVEIITEELEIQKINKGVNNPTYNLEIIETLICNAATYFYLIANEIQDNEAMHVYFMDYFTDIIEDEIQGEIKFKIFYAYCYLLKSCKIIHKKVLKGYIKEMTVKEKEFNV